MAGLPGQCCVTGNRLPGAATGTMEKVGQFDTYLINKATTDSGEKKRAIVILTDVFGLPLNNPQITADVLNERVGCDVYVPDLFQGGPPITEEALGPFIPDEAGVVQSLTTKLKLFWVILTHIHRIIPNRPTALGARAVTFLEGLKAQGYTDIGVIGYCLGGSAALVPATKPGACQSVVIAHPGPVTVAEVQAFTVPSLWLCAEDDHNLPPKLQAEFEAILREKKDTVPSEFKIFPGTAHGFAARPNQSKPHVVKAYEESVSDTVAWFQKTL